MEAGLLEAQDPLTEEESKSSPPPPASTGIIDGITCDILQVVMVVITFCMSHGLSRGLYPLVLLDAAGGSVSKAAYLQGGIMFGVHGLGFLIANPIFATPSHALSEASSQVTRHKHIMNHRFGFARSLLESFFRS